MSAFLRTFLRLLSLFSTIDAMILLPASKRPCVSDSLTPSPMHVELLRDVYTRGFRHLTLAYEGCYVLRLGLD